MALHQHRKKTSCPTRYRTGLRAEVFESRIVLARYLGADAINVEIDSTIPAVVESGVPLPPTLQFRDADFEYSSKDLSREAIDRLVATTAEWNLDPSQVGIFELDDTDYWRKAPGSYSPEVTDEGIIVARRFEQNTNSHTIISAGIRDNDCFHFGGAYTRQDYHYWISFDVRHPPSEMSWLTDHSWGLVMQLWGPRETGESARNPPFAIHSDSIDGQPHWLVRSYGDSRPITQSREFEEAHTARVQMTDIGDWHRFDVEFVPNPFGHGMIRTWLDGNLIANWQGIKNGYYSIIDDVPTGPLNPSFGLYSPLFEDGMEVHLDNISFQCSGEFQSSIAGTVTGTTDLEGNVVFATNQTTGESFATRTGRSGVYSLAVPKGVYSVTAVSPTTGGQEVVQLVSTTIASQVENLDLARQPLPIMTLTADVTGDGKSEIINQWPDGSWQVSVANGIGTYATSTWTRWSTDVAWSDVRTADFTGDGKQDIVARDSDGNWWVAESTGSRFVNRHWGKWSATHTWVDVNVGDFNGDGLPDIAGRDAESGTWWVSTSTSSRFATNAWGQWSADTEWLSVNVGDFDGDGLSDIAGRVSADGSWWVARANGTAFENQHWGAWSSSVTWNDVHVGDFDGDGISDIVGRTGGSWWVAQSTGHTFISNPWGNWSPKETWSEISVTDVNADGRGDLIGRASSDGSWWAARSIGDRFRNQSWVEVWAIEEDWTTALVDDFDGDGTAELLAVTPVARLSQ